MALSGNDQQVSARAKKGRRPSLWLAFMLLLLIGFLVAFLIRSNLDTYRAYIDRKTVRDAYIKQYEHLYEENQLLRARQAALEAERMRLADQALQERGYDDIAMQLETMRQLAGLTSVSGDGLRIVLNDASDLHQTQPTYSVIHSQDVQYIVDLLKAEGATAIAVNDQRIVMTSTLYCAGPTIRINQSRHQVPFVITAICEKNAIYDILRDDVYLSQRRDAGIRVAIETHDDVTVPAFLNPSIVESYYDALEKGGLG